MYGGPSITYQAPPPDTTARDILLAIQQDQRDIANRTEQRLQDEKAEDDARKASALAAFPALQQNIRGQLQHGLLTFEGAQNQARDYAGKYGLTSPEGFINELTTEYLGTLPTKRATGVTAAYEELLGRAPTAEELSKSQERFTQGYYSDFDDVRNAITQSAEYKKKFNNSYMDNYYDTMFGKQTLDAEGKRTGQRTFKFDKNLLPTFKQETLAKSGIELPQFGDQITGTPFELQEQVQNIRDTRQFLYSSGLTNLQGDIDKGLQEIKNKGAKEVAQIGAKGSFYSNLVSGFWG